MRVAIADVEKIASQAAAEVVRTIYARELGRPEMKDVAAAVAEKFNVPLRSLYGPRHSREISTARQVAYVLGGDVCQRSSTVVGAHFGRDHTTVLHGQRAIRRRMQDEPWLRQAVADLVGRYEAP